MTGKEYVRVRKEFIKALAWLAVQSPFAGRHSAQEEADYFKTGKFADKMRISSIDEFINKALERIGHEVREEVNDLLSR